MIFFYTLYDYKLQQKSIQAPLKKSTESENFELLIITPAIKFLGLPMGGGLVKISRLYRENGELVHARHYSPEIKQEVKELKKISKVPYLKIWKGYLILISIAILGSIIYGLKRNMDNKKYNEQLGQLTENLKQVKAGDKFGVSFYTDENGNHLGSLTAGWILVEKVEGDTLFVRRSIQDDPKAILFKKEDMEKIKPTSIDQWNSKVEKIDLPLLKSQLEETDRKRYDAFYIGQDHENYGGVIMSIQMAE